MAFERAVDLYLDIRRPAGRVLLRSKTDASPGEVPVWIEGDRFLLRVWFLAPAASITSPPTVQPVPSGSTIKLAGKINLAATNVLCLIEAFTQVGAGSDLHYEAMLDLNTTELGTALGTAGTVTMLVDVEVRDAGNTERITFRFSARVDEQVYAGDEGGATPATPPYPAPGDILLEGVAATTYLRRAMVPLVFFGQAVDEQVFGYWAAPWPCQVLGMQIAAQSAPTGSALTVDLIDGDAAELGAIATLAAAATHQETIYAEALIVPAGGIVRGKIKSVGSTAPGGYLTCNLIVAPPAGD